VAKDELQAWFEDLPGKLQRQLSRKIEAQADRLAEAQRNAYDALQVPPEESGEGRASIRVEKGRAPLTFFVKAGGPSTTKDGYDHMLGFEFGTQHQPARSFFFAPYRVIAADIRAEIEDAVAEVLDQA